MARCLYISYTGLLQPLGRSQVLAYLLPLSAENAITVISYERSADLTDVAQLSALRAQLVSAGIQWHQLVYHKRPPLLSTVFDIACGVRRALGLVDTQNFDLVHARSYVPALIAAWLKWRRGLRWVFDMRGFWVDERVDGGLWPPNSLRYRFAKRVERRLLQSADAIVSLTQAAVEEIENFDYMQGRSSHYTVIPTCVDLARFPVVNNSSSGSGEPGRDDGKSHSGDEEFVLGYVGAAGSWYLFDEVLAYYRQLRTMKPRAQLLILNRDDHELIRQKVAAADLCDAPLRVIAASFDEVPQYLAQMDAAVYFIKPCFSKRASAPTRLGELLAAGKSCVSNAGIGDSESILSGAVGYCVKDFSSASLAEAAALQLALVRNPATVASCRRRAQQYFALEDGVSAYQHLYDKLVASS